MYIYRWQFRREKDTNQLRQVQSAVMNPLNPNFFGPNILPGTVSEDPQADLVEQQDHKKTSSRRRKEKYPEKSQEMSINRTDDGLLSNNISGELTKEDPLPVRHQPLMQPGYNSRITEEVERESAVSSTGAPSPPFDTINDTEPLERTLTKKDSIQTPQDFIKQLKRDYQEHFNRKFAFEKAEYHQCIPNPAIPGGFITVQLMNTTVTACNYMPQQEKDQAPSGRGRGRQKKSKQPQQQEQQHFCEANKFKRYHFTLESEKADHDPDFDDNGLFFKKVPTAKGSMPMKKMTFTQAKGHSRNRSETVSSANPITNALGMLFREKTIIRNLRERSPQMIRHDTLHVRDHSHEVKRIGENKPLRLPTNKNSNSQINLTRVLKAKFDKASHDVDWLAAFETYLDNAGQLHPEFGVQHSRFATLQETQEGYRKKAAEVAVVAFWEPDPKEHILKCQRYFYVPYPMKRKIKESRNSNIYQILYTGREDQVFLFFDNDYNEKDSKMEFSQICLATLSLKLKQKFQAIGDQTKWTDVNTHCRVKPLDSSCVLAQHLFKLNATELADQDQIPNLTMVEYDVEVQDQSDETKQECLKVVKKQTVVFTSFLAPVSSNDTAYNAADNEYNDMHMFAGRPAVKQVNYSTIFFYDVKYGKLLQKIVGGWIFLALNDNKVWFMTRQKVAIIRWNTEISQDILLTTSNDDEDEQTLEKQFLFDYGKSSISLEQLTDYQDSRLCEAHIHHGRRRVSVQVQNFGVISFELKEAMKQAYHEFDWDGSYKSRKFIMKMAIPDQNLMGAGVDDEGASFDLQFRFVDNTEQLTQLYGYLSYQGNKENVKFNIDRGMLDHCFIKGEGQDDFGNYKIDGQIDKSSNQFKFTATYEGARMSFEGQTNDDYSVFRGVCFDPQQPDGKSNFTLKRQDIKRVIVKVKFSEQAWKDIDAEGIFYTNEVKFESIEEDPEDRLIMQASGHVDHAQEIFNIAEPDANFVLVKWENEGIDPKLMVQCSMGGCKKSNGGNILAIMNLYDLDEDVNSRNVTDRSPKNVQQKHENEPRTVYKLRFNLDKAFKNTKFTLDDSIWQCMTSSVKFNKNKGIVQDNTLLGSILYEDFDTNELKLNFYSAEIDKVMNSSLQYKQYEVPQTPLGQTWIVEYPLLAYKSCTPDNQEIVVMHLACEMPQRFIHLGGWEFVCFVNHCQMIDAKIYEQEYESTNDIMLIVRRDGLLRLMSYKTNPWEYEKDIHGISDKGIYTGKSSVFYLFNGVLGWPDVSTSASIDFQSRLLGRSCSSDKIQSCHLMAQKEQLKGNFAFVIQFNDRISTTWLENKSSTNSSYRELTQSTNMIKQCLVRAFNEKIIFAQTVGVEDRIMMLDFHPKKPRSFIKVPVHTLQGSKLILLTTDISNYQNDAFQDVKQSIFLLDDKQIIRRVSSTDSVNFEIDEEFDFSQHNLKHEMNQLKKTDWSQAFISNRAVTFLDKTYSINSSLSYKVQIPNDEDLHWNKKQTHDWAKNEELFQSQYNRDDGGHGDKDNWIVHETSIMQNTSNMLVTGANKRHQHCFLVKPAPGLRRTDLLSTAQFPEISNMYYVSNDHIIIKLNSGLSLTFNVNGQSVTQKPDVQHVLNSNYKVMSKKHILISDVGRELRSQNTILKSHKNLTSDSHQNRAKWIIYEWKHDIEPPQHADFKVIQFKPDGKGELVCSKLCHQKEHRQMLLSELMKEEIGSPSFIKQKASKNFAQHLRVDKIKIKFTGLRFLGEGTVLSVAYFVKQQNSDSSRSKTMKNQTKDKSQRMRMMINEFIDPAIKINENAIKMQLVNIECENDEEFKNFTSAKACLVGEYLALKVAKEKFVRIISLKGKYLAGKIKSEASSKQIVAELSQSKVADHEFRKIDITGMINAQDCAPDSDLINLRSMRIFQVQIIKSQHGKNEETFSTVIQVSVGNSSKMFNLDHPATIIDEQLTEPEELSYIENTQRFQDPERFVNTGYSITQTISKKEHTKKLILSNELVNNYHIRTKDVLKLGKKRIRYEQASLYRTFTELDLYQLIRIDSQLKHGNRMTLIDQYTLLSVFENQTVFSIFFKEQAVYQQIYEQINAMQKNNEIAVDAIGQANVVRQQELQLFQDLLLRVLILPVRDLLYKPTGKQGKLAFMSSSKEKYGLGFKSIMKKSVYQKSTQWMEYLIQFADVAEDISIETFVDSLDELKIMFKALSPIVVRYFEQAFVQSKECTAIQRVEWVEQAKNVASRGIVVNKSNSYITVEDIETGAFEKRKRIVRETNKRYREVSVRMLRTDWVFNKNSKGHKGNLIELTRAMAQAPDDLFKTDMFQVLISGFWNKYYRTIMIFCTIPFVCYFVCVMFYFSQFLRDHNENMEPWRQELEYYMRYIFWVLIGYQIIGELIQWMQGKIFNIKVFAVLDTVSLSINTFILVNQSMKLELVTLAWQRAMATYGIILMYTKIFYWLRMFKGYDLTVRVIRDIVFDISEFLVLLFGIVALFGNAIYILDLGRLGQENELFPAVYGKKWLGSLINQWLVALGQFDSVDVFAGENVYTVWTIFILGTLVSNIVFLNMLVALMGRTFNKTIQNTHVSLKEQVEILSDWSWIVNIVFRNIQKVNYMFSIVPVDEEKTRTLEMQLQEVTMIVQQVQEALQKQDSRQFRIESKLQSIISTMPGFDRANTQGLHNQSSIILNSNRRKKQLESHEDFNSEDID